MMVCLVLFVDSNEYINHLFKPFIKHFNLLKCYDLLLFNVLYMSIHCFGLVFEQFEDITLVLVKNATGIFHCLTFQRLIN